MTSAMTGVVWSVALGPKNTWKQQKVVWASVWIFLSYNSLIFDIQTGVLLISAISCSKDSMNAWVYGTQIQKSKRILTVDSPFSSGLIPDQFRDPLTKILVVTCGCWGARDAALNFSCTTIKWHPPDQRWLKNKIIMLSPSSEIYNHTQKMSRKTAYSWRFPHVWPHYHNKTGGDMSSHRSVWHLPALGDSAWVSLCGRSCHTLQPETTKFYSAWCQSQIAKRICRYTGAFLHGRIALCIWTCSLQSRILLLSHHMLLSPASATKRGSTRRSCSVSPSF